MSYDYSAASLLASAQKWPNDLKLSDSRSGSVQRIRPRSVHWCVHSPKNPDYLLPVQRVSARLQSRMRQRLRAEAPLLYRQVPSNVWRRPWVPFRRAQGPEPAEGLHCKSAGRGAEALSYLSRYIYKTAIPSARLFRQDDQSVTFSLSGIWHRPGTHLHPGSGRTGASGTSGDRLPLRQPEGRGRREAALSSIPAPFPPTRIAKRVPSRATLRLAQPRRQDSLRGGRNPARRAATAAASDYSPADRPPMSPLSEAIAPHRVLRPRPSMNLSDCQPESRFGECLTRLLLGAALRPRVQIGSLQRSKPPSNTQNCAEMTCGATYHRSYNSTLEALRAYLSQPARLFTSPGPKAISKGGDPA